MLLNYYAIDIILVEIAQDYGSVDNGDYDPTTIHYYTTTPPLPHHTTIFSQYTPPPLSLPHIPKSSTMVWSLPCPVKIVSLTVKLSR